MLKAQSLGRKAPANVVTPPHLSTVRFV